MSTQLQLDTSTNTLKINTGTEPVKVKNYEPLQVFNDLNPMLDKIMPDFDFNNPPMHPEELSGRLKTTMKLYGGIGLAANQCSLPFRVFVIGNGDESIACFNPRIISISEKKNEINEGCLSFPGMFLKIERPEFIEVEFENENGRTVRTKFSGVTARCFQHELDHLNGIKFTSYVGKTSLLMAKKRQDKLKKRFTRRQAR